MQEKEKVFWGEEWQPVQLKNIKKESQYEISNYGRLRRWREDLNRWNILSTNAGENTPYIYYSFSTELGWKIRKSKSLHICVAESFCHKPSEQHRFVIHLDYNKHNNKASNLRWATRAMLTTHMNNSPYNIQRKQGLDKKPSNAKLTATKVIRLKKKLARGKIPYYKLAKEFGISHTQLKRIRRGENWGDITID